MASSITSLLKALKAKIAARSERAVTVLSGHPSKNIAADLGISQGTVENHRASIMRRTGSRSLPALARLALAATSDGAEPSALSDQPTAAAR